MDDAWHRQLRVCLVKIVPSQIFWPVGIFQPQRRRGRNTMNIIDDLEWRSAISKRMTEEAYLNKREGCIALLWVDHLEQHAHWTT